jgi:hypothetical protein
MNRLFAAVDRYWYAPAPAERLALLRIACGAFAVVYLAVHAGGFTSVARFDPLQFEPVGPLAPMTSPLHPYAVYSLHAMTLLCGVAFTLGAAFRVTGPAFALLLLFLTSYRSSWGMIFHTDNLLTLHVLVLGVSPAGEALAGGKSRTLPALPDGRYGWPIRVLCAVTTLTYLLAGIAKLRTSGYDWVSGDVLRTQIAYDNLRKIELGSIHSPLGAWLVSVAWIFPPLAAVSLVLELGAPIALIGSRLAVYWVALAWSFHLGVLATMAIAFPYPLSTVAYLPFFPVERILEWRRLRALTRRL